MGKSNMVIPSHIFIETVAGICNNRCIMCPIDNSTRKGIMNNGTFAEIIRRLQPFSNRQHFFSFCGLGEPLIDRKISEKIKIAKKSGLRGLGIYTNGLILDETISKHILNAGLDTLVISIDGFTSETHEKIRIGSSLTKVTTNLEKFISLRTAGNFKTKIFIRFNKQLLNQHEENDFCNFWSYKISKSHNDEIGVYNIHNYGGDLTDFKTTLNVEMLEKMRGLKCAEIYERFMIGLDGSITFCCGDQFGRYRVGNILIDDPIKLYNTQKHIRYRNLMNQGRILDLELCKTCSVAYSIVTRTILT